MTDEIKTQGDVATGTIIPTAAKAYYGDAFTGYTSKDQIDIMLPDFKRCYFEIRKINEKPKIKAVLTEFNRQSYPQTFFIEPQKASKLLKKWNKEYEHQQTVQFIDEQRAELQRRDETLLEYTDEKLERTTRTLGGELLNDALIMLRNDQQNAEDMTPQDIINRRKYITNVLSHATKLVHGKASLMLKASEEKRNTTSFLMTLLAKATAGTISESEMALLEDTYKNKERTIVEQPQTQNG